MNPVAGFQAAEELRKHASNHIRVTQMERDIFDFYKTFDRVRRMPKKEEA